MKRRPRVSIISRESNDKTLDIRMLEGELQERGAEVETLCRLLTKEKSLRSLSYIGHVFRQIFSIARADVVVLDTYCIPVSMLPHRRKTKVIQMWHALSAVKKFGWQTVGMKDGSSARVARIMRMHRGYDYVLAASEATADHFCQAFRVSRDKIVKLGLPRVDYIRKVTARGVSAGSEAAGRIDAAGIAPGTSTDMAASIAEAYPVLRSRRRVILYAPTFHRDAPADVTGLYRALEEKIPGEYILAVKLHPIDKLRSDRIESDNVIYDTRFSSYDWLAAADAVISDYSSLVVEATLADRPLYLYVYDIDSYQETTGLNIDPFSEAIAPYVFKDADKLAAALTEDYDMELLAEFRSKYIDIDTDNCTARLADFIMRNCE